MHLIENNILSSVSGGMIGAPAGSPHLSVTDPSSSCGQIQVGFPSGASGSVAAWVGCISEISSGLQSAVQDVSNWWNQAQPVFPYDSSIYQQSTSEMLHDFGQNVGQGSWTVG